MGRKSKTLLRSEIKKQLLRDFFGKDAYRGVTFSYSWLCNQFGHFSIGFILSFFANKFLRSYELILPENQLIIAVLSSAFATFLFEMFNYFGTIYNDKNRRDVEQNWSHKGKNPE